MMVTYDWKHDAECLQRRADTFTHRSMLPHLNDLFIGQRTGFQQNRTRHSPLADIVDDPCSAKRFDLFLGNTQPPSQLRGHFPQPFAMPARVRIARFNTSSEAEEDPFGVFELVGVMLQSQQRTRSSEQFVPV